MTNSSRNISTLPPEQQSIRDRCFHPTGQFIRFEKEALEDSVATRFEKQVSDYPDHLAIKTREGELTYDALNKAVAMSVAIPPSHRPSFVTSAAMSRRRVEIPRHDCSSPHRWVAPQFCVTRA